MRHGIWLVMALAVTGCRTRHFEADPAPDTGCVDSVASIDLSPANATFSLDGAPAAPITFVATARLLDGGSATIDPSRLVWTVSRADDTPPGTIALGVLAPNPVAGGQVTVSATDGCVTAQTGVSFFLDVTRGSPADPSAWNAAPDTSGTPALIVYPSDQTRFPRNIHQTLFQWRTNGYTQFRLTFEGPGSRVTVFTDGAHPTCATAVPAAGCWEADAAAWGFLAASNAGATCTWTLDALDTSTTPPAIRRSPPITLGFSRRDVKGAIFYWSTTSKGIRRAAIGAAAPEDYITGDPGTAYATPTDEVRCVGCHTVSRNGRYIAAPVDALSGKSLWVMEVTSVAPPAPLVKSVPGTSGHGFATFSPDASLLALAWGGSMWTVDRETGAYGAPLETAPLEATQPDWSPDGSRIAFATGAGDAPAGASIAILPDIGNGQFGPAEVIAPADGKTNLFPAFSPNGDCLAYSRGEGGHNDLTAQLFVVPSGAGTPVELVNANRVVSNVLGDGQHENTMATWAPPGDFAWIAFNSMRAYGVVTGAGRQQIWVAAVDRAALAAGTADPSFPAFRLQFQGLEEDNHRAFWTLDVNAPDDGGGDLPD